jgi:hypothetical protein
MVAQKMKPNILLFVLLAGCVEPQPAPEVAQQPRPEIVKPVIVKPEVKKPTPPEVIPAPKINIRLPVCQGIPGDDVQSLNLKLDCVLDNK